ncbi:4469_t:CDS:2 [Funneliformis caledonium]|uniref:4469_t:CDS:1 n=1 Tax=Funneliformis caledonium TaxID=1117310 RepID=A0A9N9IXW8_9GLOM|nr:4469_t:CDS:2 [Funneliformis caledonium]
MHLVDSWIDSRFNIETKNALNNLTSDPKLYTILSGWYATKSLFILTNIQNDEDENSSKSIFDY